VIKNTAGPIPLSISVGEPSLITEEAVREPQLFRLRNGDVLLTYHVQGDMHFAERRGMRSSDGGHTWQTEPQRSHREEALGQAADGTVLAADMYTFERRPGEYVGSFYRSEDGGVSFTGPHPLTVHLDRVKSAEYPTPEHIPPEGHGLRKFYQPLPDYYMPTVAASSRRLGFTFWRYFLEQEGQWLATMQGYFHGDRFYRTILVCSEDGGLNWHYVSTVAAGLTELTLADGMCEPVLCRLPDGSLLCVMRRGGKLPLAQSRSLDGGVTWSEVELLPGHGVDPDLHVMSNGVLVCTYGRPGRFLMCSEDGHGFGWGYRTPIGSWRGSTYMGAVEVAPDTLLVAYDRREELSESGEAEGAAHVGMVRIKISRG